MIENYKQLTLEKYLEIKNLDLEQPEIDIHVQIISILSDLSEDEVLDLPLPEYKKMVAKTSFLYEEPKAEKHPPREITINGRKYEVLRDAKKMTAGQYIDYQSYLKGDVESNLPLILSTFCVPKGEKYGETPVEDVVEDMKVIPVQTVLTLSRFFFRQSQNSINSILLFLEWTTKRMKKKEKNKEITEKMETALTQIRTLQDLVNGGDGWR